MLGPICICSGDAEIAGLDIAGRNIGRLDNVVGLLENDGLGVGGRVLAATTALLKACTTLLPSPCPKVA